jgi:hypothetical protein
LLIFVVGCLFVAYGLTREGGEVPKPEPKPETPAVVVEPPKTKLVSHKVMIGQYNPGGYEFYGCGTKIKDIVILLCQGAIDSNYIQTYSRGGEQCGYTGYTVNCLMPD